MDVHWKIRWTSGFLSLSTLFFFALLVYYLSERFKAGILGSERFKAGIIGHHFELISAESTLYVAKKLPM